MKLENLYNTNTKKALLIILTLGILAVISCCALFTFFAIVGESDDSQTEVVEVQEPEVTYPNTNDSGDLDDIEQVDSEIDLDQAELAQEINSDEGREITIFSTGEIFDDYSDHLGPLDPNDKYAHLTQPYLSDITLDANGINYYMPPAELQKYAEPVNYLWETDPQPFSDAFINVSDRRFKDLPSVEGASVQKLIMGVYPNTFNVTTFTPPGFDLSVFDPYELRYDNINGQSSAFGITVFPYYTNAYKADFDCTQTVNQLFKDEQVQIISNEVINLNDQIVEYTYVNENSGLTRGYDRCVRTENNVYIIFFVQSETGDTTNYKEFVEATFIYETQVPSKEDILNNNYYQ